MTEETNEIVRETLSLKLNEFFEEESISRALNYTASKSCIRIIIKFARRTTLWKNNDLNWDESTLEDLLEFDLQSQRPFVKMRNALNADYDEALKTFRRLLRVYEIKIA